MHNDLEHRALQAQNTTDEYIQRHEQASGPSGKSHRYTVELTNTRLGRRTVTGYRQYCNACKASANRPSQNGEPTASQRRLAAIMDKYSHTDESIVVVAALCSSRNQQQAMVQWAPCVQPGWQLCIQKSSGYQVCRMSAASPLDLQQFGLDTQRPCEYCAEPATSTEQNCKTYTISNRWYHTTCIQKCTAKPPTQQQKATHARSAKRSTTLLTASLMTLNSTK
jgi:hypothetical protein